MATEVEREHWGSCCSKRVSRLLGLSESLQHQAPSAEAKLARRLLDRARYSTWLDLLALKMDEEAARVLHGEPPAEVMPLPAQAEVHITDALPVIPMQPHYTDTDPGDMSASVSCD